MRARPSFRTFATAGTVSNAHKPPRTVEEILSDVVEVSLLLLNTCKRFAALELALRKSKVLQPGELERAQKFLAGFPEDAESRLAARLASVDRRKS